MSERVAIVGVKQSRYQAEKKSQHLTELVYEVVNGLFAGLGITPAGVDTIASCSQDFIDGRTISNRTIPEVEGAYLKSEAKVAGDGSMDVFFGMIRPRPPRPAPICTATNSPNRSWPKPRPRRSPSPLKTRSPSGAARLLRPKCWPRPCSPARSAS